jgi:hypothetical protein
VEEQGMLLNTMARENRQNMVESLITNYLFAEISSIVFALSK